MEGPEKQSGMDCCFSVEALTPHQVAETLTAVTGRKFTAAVRHAKGFQNDAAQPGAFEPAYAKGGLDLFRQVEDGRSCSTVPPPGSGVQFEGSGFRFHFGLTPHRHGYVLLRWGSSNSDVTTPCAPGGP